MKTYTTKNALYEVQIPEEYEEGVIYVKEWNKYGKERLYITVYYKDGSMTSCGYVDLTNGYVSSSPSKTAKNIESEIIITKKDLADQPVQEPVEKTTGDVVYSLKKVLYEDHSRSSDIATMLGFPLYVVDEKNRWAVIDAHSTVESFSLANGFSCDFLLVDGKVMGGFGRSDKGEPIEITRLNMKQAYELFKNNN